MISDALTKDGLNRQPLLDIFRLGSHRLCGDAPKRFQSKNAVFALEKFVSLDV